LGEQLRSAYSNFISISDDSNNNNNDKGSGNSGNSGNSGGGISITEQVRVRSTNYGRTIQSAGKYKYYILHILDLTCRYLLLFVDRYTYT